LGVAAATLIMMMWGLGRPALWLDESASVIATQRSWAGLWVLFGGTDAPLVPYYALLRTASSAVTSTAPDSAASPELLFRWPSVAVTVLGAWALTLWLARRCPPELAISTAALLLATGSFSRYAQEARPYAFVLAAAVACTILWTRLIRDESRRWVVLHALAVASLIAAHLLAASLVFAHLVAAAITSTKENRRSVVLRTSVAAALGLLLVSPISITAALHGQGPRLTASLPAYVPPVLVDALTEAGVLAVGLGLVSALAVCVALAFARGISSSPGLPWPGRWSRWWSCFPL
jgi:mannosyltransferase